MIKRRKLKSHTRKERFKYDWSDFFGLIVVTVESEFSPSVGRIANSTSPKGQYPDVMILHNSVENSFTVLLNNRTVEDSAALKFLRSLESDFNRIDDTAKYGGSKWRIDMQDGNLQSPNHGCRSSLDVAKIITVIGMKQYFHEINRMRSVVLLPSPGQVDATQSMRMMLEKTSGEMPLGGKIEVIKGNVKITLRGSL